MDEYSVPFLYGSGRNEQKVLWFFRDRSFWFPLLYVLTLEHLFRKFSDERVNSVLR